MNLCTKRNAPLCGTILSMILWGTILSTESKVLYKQTKQYPHECGAGEISCKTVIFHSWLEGCMLLTLGSFSNGDGDGSETVKTANRFIKQNNRFARASRFSVHFLAVTTRLRRENA